MHFGMQEFQAIELENRKEVKNREKKEKVERLEIK